MFQLLLILLVATILLVRATAPRFRTNQLINFVWKFLILYFLLLFILVWVSLILL